MGDLFYVVVYTGYLKRRTAQNIVIGGAAGAVPPVVGYAAVSGHVTVTAALLFLIVFVWTPPHFWALAMLIKGDYAAAGIPMLPVVRGDTETTRQIVRYTVLMIAVTLLPVATGSLGWEYAVAARAAGRRLLWMALGPSPDGLQTRRQGAVSLLAAVPRAAVRRHGGGLRDLTARTCRRR